MDVHCSNFDAMWSNVLDVNIYLLLQLKSKSSFKGYLANLQAPSVVYKINNSKKTDRVLTSIKCHNYDKMWSDFLNIALSMFVNYRNSDAMWFDVLDVTLPTLVNCRNFDEMWVRRFKHRSFDVCKLSQF